MNYMEINSNKTTVVKTGAGVFSGIVVNNPGSAWTLQIFDNTTAAAPAIAGSTAFACPTAGLFLPYRANFNNGLTIVTAGTTAGSITVIYT